MIHVLTLEFNISIDFRYFISDRLFYLVNFLSLPLILFLSHYTHSLHFLGPLEAALNLVCQSLKLVFDNFLLELL